MKESNLEKRDSLESPSYEEFLDVCENFDWLLEEDWDFLREERDYASAIGYLYGVLIEKFGGYDRIYGLEDILVEKRFLENQADD